MSNPKTNKAAKAITPTKNLTLRIMEWDSEGDHDAIELSVAHLTTRDSAPDVHNDIFQGRDPFNPEYGEINSNPNTRAQIAQRLMLERGVCSKDDMLKLHPKTDRNGGVFIVERRQRIKRNNKIEDQISKVYKKIEFTIGKDGKWRFPSFVDCPITECIIDSGNVISGNDFKVKICEPIIAYLQGFKYSIKSKVCFRIGASIFDQLQTYVDAYINTTIPAFEAYEMQIISGTSKVAHAQKSIFQDLNSLISEAERQLQAHEAGPTHHRAAKTRSAMAQAEKAIGEFYKLLKMQSMLTSMKLEDLEETMKDMGTRFGTVNWNKEKSTRAPSQKKIMAAKLSAAEAKQAELEAIIAKLQAELNSKK